MATIRQNLDDLVVLSGDRIVIFIKGVEHEFQLPIKKEEEEKQKDKEDSGGGDGKSEIKNCVLASAFSKSGKYFAVADDEKQLHVYKVTSEFELHSTRYAARRCTAITFPSAEDYVIVADRTGDVYRFLLNDPHADGELLLGHLSMVIDVLVTVDDKYILTCDRDEKVRISCYPNSYNIHAFCLLHTEYVSQLLYIDKKKLIVSGSGDGRLALWDTDGNNHSVTVETLGQSSEGQEDVKGQTDESCDPLGVKRMVYDQKLNVIAVIYYRSNLLHFFTLQEGGVLCQLCREKEISLTVEPWDIDFDSSHQLWVLQPCEANPVIVYNCCRGEDHTIKVSVEGVNQAASSIVNTLCKKWDFFKVSQEYQPQCMSLTKQRTSENVTKYLERKEDRINNKKNKEPPQKKIKTS